MENIKEFKEHPLSRTDFWLTTGPLCAAIIVLAIIIIFWKHSPGSRFRAYVRWKLGLPPKKKIGDDEDHL